MEVDSWLTGRRGVTLPFADECGPLASNIGEARSLLEGALQFGRARGWRWFEARGDRALLGVDQASITFYGHSLNLAVGEAILLAGIRSSVRTAIRKAEASGLKVEVTNSLTSVADFYHLYCLTRKRHGLPPQPYRFFKAIHHHILEPGMGFIVLARLHGICVAAAVFFHAAQQALFKYGASDERFQHIRGSNLVMWTAIKWYAQRGIKSLHFGRTSLTNVGLRRFKLGWGSDEYSIEYVRYDFGKGRFVTDTKDAATGWHNSVFRATPTWMSRLAGQVLYRHWG
jgi:hypothetical protein